MEPPQSCFERLFTLVWKSTGPVVDIETKTLLHSLGKLTTLLLVETLSTHTHTHTDTYTYTRTHSHANTTRPEPVPTLH
jgi:hypothetical protein